MLSARLFVENLQAEQSAASWGKVSTSGRGVSEANRRLTAVIFLFSVMRRLVLKCLIALLSLALVSGNAHAVLHLAAGSEQDCPGEPGHHHPGGEPSHHHHHEGLLCCCDCLGCVSANLTPEPPGSVPAALAAAVHYDERTVLLSGRVLLPEPEPPRPNA